MRCHVCHELFFAYEGMPAGRGVVCSKACANMVDLLTADASGGGVTLVDEERAKPVGENGES